MTTSTRKVTENGRSWEIPEERIVIERRETIAIVDSDPSGTRPMVEIAFELASRYVTETAEEGKPIAVSFEWGMHKWEVSAMPLG